MSRTYRTAMIGLTKDHKILPSPKMGAVWDEYDYGEDIPYDYYSRYNMKFDKKPWNKSPKWYKKIRARLRRARERQAIKNKNYDNVPKFKKENDWHWT